MLWFPIWKKAISEEIAFVLKWTMDKPRGDIPFLRGKSDWRAIRCG